MRSERRGLHARGLVVWPLFAVLLGLLLPVAASASTLVVATTKLQAAVANTGDHFGSACAKDGDTVVVGVPNGSGNAGHSGVAYVYVPGGSGWVQQAKLMAPDGTTSDYFGASVAIDGDVAVVGAPRRQHAAEIYAGSAYIFTRSGTTWTYTAELKAADYDDGDTFGSSVAIDGSSIIIGAPLDNRKATGAGSAYAFVHTGGVWVQQYKMYATDAQLGDQFGRSVGVSGSRAVVGAIEEDGKGSNAGAAYVFERSGLVWSQKAEIRAADGAANDVLGSAVAISGSTVVLGAPGNSTGADRIGKAYVFTRQIVGLPSVYGWLQQAKLKASDGTLKDGFGSSVDIDGDRVVIGAPTSTSVALGSGSAYTCNRNGSAWTEAYKLVAIDGAADDLFGTAVAIGNGVVAIGAPHDDDAINDRGSVYVRATNVPPTAAADTYAASADATLTVAAPGILANDSDPDGNGITAVKASDPAHGALTLNSNGSLTYRPATGYFGSDSFTYHAYDGLSYSPTRTVTFVVTDTVKPSVSHSAPLYSADLTTVTISAPDAGSGIKQIEYAVNGGAVTIVDTVTAVVSLTQLGRNTLSYRALDRSDNYSDWAVVTIDVRHTSLTLTVPATSPYGSAVVSGYLGHADASGTIVPLAGKTVTIQFYSSGTWMDLAHITTSETGSYAVTLAPREKTTYRACFEQSATDVGATSATGIVLPRVSLASPSFGHKKLTYHKSYSVSGNLKPRHAVGSKQIKLRAYHFEGGSYVYKRTYTAKASNKSSYSVYKVSIKLPSHGKWRLRAYHAADATNAKTYSAYRYVTVR